MKLVGIVVAVLVISLTLFTVQVNGSSGSTIRGDFVIENKTYYFNSSMEIQGNFIVKNSTVIANESGLHITVHGDASFINSSFGTSGEGYAIRILGNMDAEECHFKNIGVGLGYWEGIRVEDGYVHVNNSEFEQCFRGIAAYNSTVYMQNNTFNKGKIGVSVQNSTLHINNMSFNGVSHSGVGMRILESKAYVNNTEIQYASTGILSWKSNISMENISILHGGNGYVALGGDVSIKNSTLGWNLWSNIELGRDSTGELTGCEIHTSVTGIYLVNSKVDVNWTDIYNVGVGIFTSQNSFAHVENSSLIGSAVTFDSHGFCEAKNIYAIPFVGRGNYSVNDKLANPPTAIKVDIYENTNFSGNIEINNITILNNSKIENATVNFQSNYGGNVIVMLGNSSIINTSFEGNLYTIHIGDDGLIKNVYTTGQLGVILHDSVTVDNITTEDGLLRGIIGLLLVNTKNTIVENSVIRGNILGAMMMDSNNLTLENLTMYNNAFNSLAYHSKNITLTLSELRESILGLAAYRVDGMTVEKSKIENSISLLSMQYTNYTVKDTQIIWNGTLGILSYLLNGVYINETIGIISEFSTGYVENTSFIGMEKGITNYHSESLKVERSYFDDCLLGIKSDSFAEINNSTFAAVGIYASGNVEVNNSYFFTPDSNPSYLFINGAKFGKISSTPPVNADVAYASGNVSGKYYRTVIVNGESTIQNATFYRGLIFYNNSVVEGSIEGKNYMMMIPKSVSVKIQNATLNGQKGIVVHSKNIEVKNVKFNGQFDILIYNISGIMLDNITSSSVLSVYAYSSSVIIANSTFTGEYTCIADNSTINVVSSNYTWTYFRNNGKVYHSHWLTVNVLNTTGEHMGANVVLKYDNANHTYYSPTGRITIPAPYSKRSFWWEENFNISVTAINQYNYPWVNVSMNSDEEITLTPNSVPEMTQFYIIFAAAIILLSLKNRKFLILFLLIPPLMSYQVHGTQVRAMLGYTENANLPPLDIKSGDILLMGMNWMTPGVFSHTAVFHMKAPDGEWLLFESNEHGAHGSYFSSFTGESHLVALRTIGLSPTGIEQALSAMRERVGFAYDPVWLIRSFSADSQYCSGYAYLGFNSAGLNLDPLNGVWGWNYGLGVAPSSLLMSPNVEIVWWL